MCYHYLAMAVREIKLMGEDILRQVSRQVPQKEINSQSIQKLIDDMLETAAQTPEGGFITAGLAAPQVGESLRLFLVMKEGSDRKNPEYDIYINPELDFSSTEVTESEESCLSTPGLCGLVRRYKDLKITYFNREGEKQRKKVTGEQSIFIQHEFDHLEGILWVDKVIDTKTMSFC